MHNNANKLNDLKDEAERSENSLFTETRFPFEFMFWDERSLPGIWGSFNWQVD